MTEIKRWRDARDEKRGRELDDSVEGGTEERKHMKERGREERESRQEDKEERQK